MSDERRNTQLHGVPPDKAYNELRDRLIQLPLANRSSFAVQLAVAFGCGVWRTPENVTGWAGHWDRAKRSLITNIQYQVAKADRWLAKKVAGFPDFPDSNCHVGALVQSLLDPLAPLQEGILRIECVNACGCARGEITSVAKERSLLRGNKRVYQVLENAVEVSRPGLRPLKIKSPGILRLSWERDSSSNEFVSVTLRTGTQTNKIRLNPGDWVILAPASRATRLAEWTCDCGRVEKCPIEHRLDAWSGWLADKPLPLWSFIANAINGPKVPVTAGSFAEGMYYPLLNRDGITD